MKIKIKSGRPFLNGDTTTLVSREYFSEKGILIYELYNDVLLHPGKSDRYIHQECCEIVEEVHTSEAIPNQMFDFEEYDKRVITITKTSGYKSSFFSNEACGEING